MRIIPLFFYFACSSETKIGNSDTGTIQDGYTDADGDGFDSSEDCNDNDPQVHPSQEEVCDGVDNNCNGSIDEDVLSLYYVDSDGDGFGNPDINMESCSEPTGFVSIGTDCDDTQSQTYPGASEICDEQDNDCDGSIDNGLGEEYFIDEDGDGFGDDNQTMEACDLRVGLSALGGDCNDTDASQNPLAQEECDEIDNNCDGNIDENVTNIYYLDFDADGYGDPDQTTQACMLPAGYVETADDCDDIEVLIHPNAEEICDNIDNNCDGNIDDTSSINASIWYEDGDDDGYGNASVTQVACTLPTGFVPVMGDCNDNNENISPAADELCNGVDDNCDEEVDEEGSVDAPVWYLDADGDGFGTTNTSIFTCTQPTGFQSNSTDCDDQDNDIYPQAPEYCNGEDDNCDGTIDEDHAINAQTWYLDNDEDGYGDAAILIMSCAQPVGHVSNLLDCDDSVDTISPDADEICDGQDNDCDGQIDGASAIDPNTWYADADGDGFGSMIYTTQSCDQPSGYVSDDQDCNDLESTFNPDADEICDGSDNNCDGQIDEEGAIDGSIWYQDDDHDGLGDLSNTLESCDQPPGYVDNGDDCDDSSSSDIDGDGTQDCSDDDIDGDGLRNIWDAAPEDESITRPPNSGTGALGNTVISTDVIWEEYTTLDGGAQSGNAVISVIDGSIFSLEDEILILSQQGSDAGQYETAFVVQILGNQLEIEPNLTQSYSSQSTVLVQHIPHYQNIEVTSAGSISTVSWDGNGGGVIIARATESIVVDGVITTSNQGFRGGNGVFGNSSDPTQGESYQGLGQSGITSTNLGGGGAYPRRSDNSDSGGGGGYGESGTAGVNYYSSAVTSGGQSYGTADLTSWFFGSGGGGGSPDTEGDGVSNSNYAGDGGAGGGLISLFAGTEFTISGSILSNGKDGDDGVSGGGEVGAGGGGSGGMIYLASPELSITGTVQAQGGTGGIGVGNSGPYGSAQGGNGGDGRVRLDYNNLTGTSSTTIGYTQSYNE